MLPCRFVCRPQSDASGCPVLTRCVDRCALCSPMWAIFCVSLLCASLGAVFCVVCELFVQVDSFAWSLALLLCQACRIVFFCVLQALEAVLTGCVLSLSTSPGLCWPALWVWRWGDWHVLCWHVSVLARKRTAMHAARCACMPAGPLQGLRASRGLDSQLAAEAARLSASSLCACMRWWVTGQLFFRRRSLVLPACRASR